MSTPTLQTTLQGQGRAGSQEEARLHQSATRSRASRRSWSPPAWARPRTARSPSTTPSPRSPRSPARRPSITFSKKAVANFKLREGEPLGARVTLRGARMWEFLDRFINVTAPEHPRLPRDLLRSPSTAAATTPAAFSDQSIFPEIELDQIKRHDRLRPDLRDHRQHRRRGPRAARRTGHAVPRHARRPTSQPKAGRCLNRTPTKPLSETPSWQFSPIQSPTSSRASRTACRAGNEEFTAPYSKIKADIARILQEEGYIWNYEVVTTGKYPEIKVKPTYVDGRPVLTDLKRVSKPGRRRLRRRRRNPARPQRPRHLHPLDLARA